MPATLDLQETEDAVTVTLGAIAGPDRCLVVELEAPLGGRRVLDGATGEAVPPLTTDVPGARELARHAEAHGCAVWRRDRPG